MAGKQLGFSDYKPTAATKQIKRETFFSEMLVVVLSAALIVLIKFYYPKEGEAGGRPPR